MVVFCLIMFGLTITSIVIDTRKANQLKKKTGKVIAGNRDEA